MNRFLRSATAVALGLGLCGTAKADGRTDQRVDQERLERDPNADDAWRYLDPWRLPFERDDLRYFDHWWLDRDDLRHFEHFDYWRVNHYGLHHGGQ